MLIGRERELAVLERLLEGAARQTSASLVFVGDPGIGKTALLEACREAAEERGMTVLRTHGVESEAELAFSGLFELLRPLLDRLAGIPPTQADALSAAFALTRQAPSSDRFAVAAATLSLLAAAAEREPVVVLVDDAQWLDAASGEALAFAARRLRDEPVVILWSIRDGEELRFSLDGIEELRVEGLDPASSLILLEAGGNVIARSVVEQLVAATGGNPLALLELVDLLTARQLAGQEPVEPLPASRWIERSFGRRVASLDQDTQRALLVAAASETGELGVLARALATLGLSLDALLPGERDGLVQVSEDRLEFRHPLVRSAVYAGADSSERRSAHAAIAAALAGDPHDERRVWHLAAATVGPDEEVAQGLERVGRRAVGQSYHAAARAFGRAAAHTEDEQARAVRLFEAARCAYESGDSATAGEELREALALEPEEALRGRLVHLLGRVEIRQAHWARAARMLSREAGQLESDPETAALMLTDAAGAAFEAGDRDEAFALIDRAWELAWPRGGFAEVLITLRRADYLAWSGNVQEPTPLWLRVADVGLRGSESNGEPNLRSSVAEALFSAGEDERARAMLLEEIDDLRSATALGRLPQTLILLSLVEARGGQPSAAATAAAEAADLAAALAQPGIEATALGELAWAEAMLGRERDCREHAERAAELVAATARGRATHRGALGLMELLSGRPEEAVGQLDWPGRRDARAADPIYPRSTAPVLVEAYARTGRLAEAREELDVFERQAELSGRPGARAAAARCRGFIADGDAFGSHYERALELHAQDGNGWERARTHLCYGEALRRSKRRTEAREQLRLAATTFEELGAGTYAERARTELRATGERIRRRDPSTRDELTPQEQHVAALVAEGLTNREIATRLFISPNTVETHLRHVFRKLGIRSRTELAVLLSERSDGDEDHGSP